ncbi:MAG TPA: hypothetical protein VLF89_06460 [Candidatus Saccharimonadales bacterium]|nr:hypothetical protein [Candidatus Saccharimonadales bacterium]
MEEKNINKSASLSDSTAGLKMDRDEEQEKIKESSTKRKKMSLKEKIRKLPDKKPHLDFIAAILTIPLLVLTLYLNIANLKGKNNSTLTPTPTQVSIPNPTSSMPAVTRIVTTATPQPTADTNTCVKDIGPISIDSPTEGQTVSDNPVCIDINYQAGNYCSVVWSYRVNNGDWSDYSNNSVCLYNLPSGTNSFDLRIKSLSSASTKTLHRSFVYKSTQNITPSVTQMVTSAPTPTSAQ